MLKRKTQIHRIVSFLMVLSLVIMTMPGMEVKAENYRDYRSFEEDVAEGGTITLTQDVTVSMPSGRSGNMIFVKRSCTLNGNNHSFEGADTSTNVNLLISHANTNYSGATFNLTNITLKSNRCRMINPRNSMVFNADSTVMFEQGHNILGWGGALAEIDSGATLNLNGSTVDGIKSGGSGGALNIKENGTANLNYTGYTSHQITNCVASGQGGVANIQNGGSLTITDATIRNNSAVSNGGAIYLEDGGVLTLKGNTNITGNTVSGSANNIYLAPNAVITLDGFTGSAGVTTESAPTTTSEIKIATGATVADATRITPDNTSYFVRYKSADRCLYLTSVDPASSVTDMINSLPSEQDITLGDQDAIEAARTAYTDLTDEQKGRVSSATLSKLTNAENKLVVLKVMSEVSARTGSDMAYTGSPIRLINTPTTSLPQGFSVMYAVTAENVAPDASLYSTSIPTATNSGTYYVWYKTVDGNDHIYSGPASVTVTVSGQAQPTPSGGSSGGSSGSSFSGSSASPIVATQETASGETKVTNTRGEAISNSLVTVKIKDASGNTVSKQVLTDEQGNIAKKEVVTVSREVSASGKTTEVEKSYLAASDGTIYDTPGFTDVSDVMGLDRSDLSEADKVVFIKGDGSLMQAEKFTVTTKTGKKIMYAADENCNIIRNGFFNAKKTGVTGKAAKSGASYFAKANGQIITNALFTVKPTKNGKVKVKINKKGSGPEETVIIDDMELYFSLKGAKAGTAQAQYYATKSGKLAKNQWVNVGVKDYYCGSSGKITKSKKHIINNT